MDKAPSKISRGTSRWKRKSFRRTDTDTTASSGRAETSSDAPSEKGKERASEELDASGLSHWSNSVQSVVPERLKDLPPWYNREMERTAMTAMQFRQRYPIHNPVGPRVYKNFHLIPPQRRPGGRPSSVFSPSFPPISASTGDHPMHTVSMPAPPVRRTPSASPLGTPSSSAIHVNEAGLGGKMRSRKVSQGSPHDNVDLMDVSDPWGTNWHHTSPYDVGIRKEGEISPVGGDPSTPHQGRLANRHKTVTPSPLSQSTSALHLQPTEAEGAAVTKKLSKRRKINPFSSASQPDIHSAPATPVGDEPSITVSSPPPVSRPRRRISLRPSASTTDVPQTASLNSLAPPSSKKDKRGSILVRIARRFSILRRPAPHPPSPARMAEKAAEDGSTGVTEFEVTRQSAMIDPRPSFQGSDIMSPGAERTSSSDMSGEDDEVLTIPGRPKNREEGETKRSSMSILEAPFVMGNLTIANPDDIRESAASTPQQPPFTTLMSPEPQIRTEDLARPPSIASPESTPVTPAVAKSLPPRPPPTEAPTSDDEESILVPPRAPGLRNTGIFSSPTLTAQTAVTMPSPSEMAYLSSPSLPAQEDIPSIPSPPSSTDLTSPLPTPDTLVLDPPAPRFTTKSAPWAEEARVSVLANPPTPFSGAVPMPIPTASPAPAPRLSIDETPRGAGPRGPSPTKSRHHGDRVASPVAMSPPPVSPVSPTPQGRQRVPSSRETSPTKVSRDRAGSVEQARSPSTRERERESPTKPSRERQSEHTRRESEHSRRESDHTRRESRRDSEVAKSTTTTTSVRRTETFRLVRSPSSGMVPGASGTIMANGEHWEVVEQPVLSPKRSSRRDRAGSQSLETQQEAAEPSSSSSTRKESRRREKEDADHPRKESRREKDRKSQDGEDAAAAAARREHRRKERRRSEATNGSAASPTSTSHPSRHSEDRRHGHADADTSRSIHERRSSQSTRPTSEIPSAADIASLKARDAYELERMRKGRSAALDSGMMLTPPGTQTVLPSIAGTASHAIGPGPGSAHTSYASPTPFPAPPVVYPPVAPGIPTAAPRGSRSRPSRSSADGRPLSNPLPEPPRQSAFAGPLTPPVIGDSSPGSREYWAKYAGLTASH